MNKIKFKLNLIDVLSFLCSIDLVLLSINQIKRLTVQTILENALSWLVYETFQIHKYWGYSKTSKAASRSLRDFSFNILVMRSLSSPICLVYSCFSSLTSFCVSSSFSCRITFVSLISDICSLKSYLSSSFVFLCYCSMYDLMASTLEPRDSSSCALLGFITRRYLALRFLSKNLNTPFRSSKS